MSKSCWKRLYDKNIPNSFENKSEKDINFSKFFLRNNIIEQKYLDLQISIYNGLKYYNVLITDKMLKQKFGEFSPTRKLPVHKKKKK